MSATITTLIVDDSLTTRNVLRRFFGRDPEFIVIDSAVDGEDALQKILTLRPQVITLDLNMPKLDGLSVLQRIFALYRPVVIIISGTQEDVVDKTMRAMELGAVEFIQKSEFGTRSADDHARFRRRIKLLVRAQHPQPVGPAEMAPAAPVGSGAPQTAIVAIGVSTGGPQALHQLLPRLPADLPAAVLVVQHIQPLFSRSLAEHLNAVCTLPVAEAADGEPIRAGMIRLAPGDRHLLVERSVAGAGVLRLSADPPVNEHRPSADVLFTAVAAHYRSAVIGVIMTGLGRDGAKGMAAISMAGGYTIAQDKASCVVFGMPKSAIENGSVEEVVGLDRMAEAIIRQVRDRA